MNIDKEILEKVCKYCENNAIYDKLSEYDDFYYKIKDALKIENTTRKVVINTCYGGFGISSKAIIRYYEIKEPQTKLYFYKEEYDPDGELVQTPITDPNSLDKSFRWISIYRDVDRKERVGSFDFSREDPILIQVIEELGEESWGQYAKLSIVEVTGPYRICEYDGTEWIETPDSINWDN